MFGNNRRAEHVVGGVILVAAIAAVLLTGILSNQVNNSGEKPGTTDFRTFVSGDDGQSSTPSLVSDCSEVNDGNELAFCVQQRMAKAAEDQVWWLRLETIFLGLTLAVAVVGAVGAVAAVKHTRRQADIAADTERRQLRAYLEVRSSGITDFRHEIADAVVNLRVENMGQTPARRLVSRITVAIGHPPFEGTMRETLLSLQSLTENVTSNDMSVGRGAPRSMHHTVERNWVTSHAAQLEHPDHRIFVVGAIAYEDIFGTRHSTAFCHWYRAGRTGRGDAHYHDIGNDAD